MNMKYVTKEQAERLKKLEFDVPVSVCWYSGDTSTNCDHFLEGYAVVNHNDLDLCTSCPDMHECTDWLREVKGLHLSTCPEYTKSGKWFYILCISTDNVWHSPDISESSYDTHEAALSAGIDHALSIL